MTNAITTVNVNQIQAPTPNRLQKTGAFISQGGTTLGAGTYSLLTQAADLTALLAASLAITSMAWASTYGGQVTVTTTVAHGIPVNEQFVTTVAGVVPAGYNGTYLATSTGTSTFTYALVASPGSATTQGTYSPRNVAELVAMAATFFAQGAQQAVYVLELGAGTVAAGVTALTNFINNSDQFFYSYLVPRNWDGVSSFLSFLAGFETTTSKTYFYVTTTLQNYGLYTSLMKCVFALVEAPNYGVWAADTVSAASYSAGTVTVTTSAAHGVYPGQYFTLSGILPAGYNGTFRALPGTTGSTLTYALASDPGAYSSGGSMTARLYASAGIPATEFTAAAPFHVTLNYAPSNTNKVTPLVFAQLFGVTAFPTRGNAALLVTLRAANINIVGTGAEGGITNTILFWGHTMDGRPFNYWYATDWLQINVQLAVSNAVINGSNDTFSPLYYNQNGIDRLQQVAVGVAQSAITFGLALGPTVQSGDDGDTFQNNLNEGLYAGKLVINAVPFINYTAANPSAYRDGEYAGFAVVATPTRAFESITFTINVTDFVAA